MAEKFKKEKQFKTRWHHRRFAYWLTKAPKREPGFRNEPVLIRLDVVPGHKASRKPPVRIYLGTEPAQYRSERVFIWSVMQVRDPARIYEIYLMKDIKGYDRTGWKTGFTNYRYGIPAMAGGKGRAIYNDVDQIYLSDPAELFDMDMNGAGFLGITGRETSVMLIDCEKMIEHWTLADAQAGKKHRHFRELSHDRGLWGQMPPEWNARDEEFSPGQSKCFHFTTLQTQPWQPFPDQLNYQPHPDGEVWFALERSADEARFTPFTKDNPSPRFAEMVAQYRTMHEQGEAGLGLEAHDTFDGHSLAKHDREIARLIAETGADTILDYGCGKAGLYQPAPGEPENGQIKSLAAWGGVKVTCYDPGYKPFAKPYKGTFDGVISTDVLEHIPEEDIGWVLNEMFAAADRFVYVVAACYPARKTLPDGTNAHVTLQSPDWWRGQLELAAQRTPGPRWVLCTETRTPIGKRRSHVSGNGVTTKAA